MVIAGSRIFSGKDANTCPMQNDCTVQVYKMDNTHYHVSTNANTVSVDTNTGDVTLTKASYAYTEAHKIKTTCNGAVGQIF